MGGWIKVRLDLLNIPLQAATVMFIWLTSYHSSPCVKMTIKEECTIKIEFWTLMSACPFLSSYRENASDDTFNKIPE